MATSLSLSLSLSPCVSHLIIRRLSCRLSLSLCCSRPLYLFPNHPPRHPAYIRLRSRSYNTFSRCRLLISSSPRGVLLLHPPRDDRAPESADRGLPGVRGEFLAFFFSSARTRASWYRASFRASSWLIRCVAEGWG